MEEDIGGLIRQEKFPPSTLGRRVGDEGKVGSGRGVALTPSPSPTGRGELFPLLP